jgi:hypothetical protein
MLLISRKRNVDDLPLIRGYIRRGAIAASGLALAITACSSSGGPHAATTPAPATTGPVNGATYRGTIYVSSQVNGSPQSWHVTKSFTERRPDVRNCAAAARTGTGTGVFQVPSPKAPLPQDNIEVRGFHGPGSYSPAAMQHDKSDFIMMPGKSGMQQYDITASAPGSEPGKEALFLYGNGSGQLVYSQAHLDGKASGPTVAGLITWNCTS